MFKPDSPMHIQGRRKTDGPFSLHPQPTAPILYERVLEEWLCSMKMHVKESTCARYAHLVRTHIQPALGQYPLSRLTSQTVEAFILQQLDSGRLDGKGGLSPKTVSDMLVLIKTTLDYARFKGYKGVCNIGKLTIRKKEKEMRVLTPQEQMLLVQHLTRDMDACKFGTLLALYTGIRIGELCALKWEDVCLSQGILKIKKTMQRVQNTAEQGTSRTKIIVTEPKSRCSKRDIPLPAFLLAYARQFAACPQAYVLTGTAARYMEPRTLQNRFKSCIAQSGLKKANFHALRHTFATRCVEVGFDIKSLSEILGHASVNITLNRYIHSSFALKRSQMDKLKLQK